MLLFSWELLFLPHPYFFLPFLPLPPSYSVWILFPRFLSSAGLCRERSLSRLVLEPGGFHPFRPCGCDCFSAVGCLACQQVLVGSSGLFFSLIHQGNCCFSLLPSTWMLTSCRSYSWGWSVPRLLRFGIYWCDLALLTRCPWSLILLSGFSAIALKLFYFDKIQKSSHHCLFLFFSWVNLSSFFHLML